MKKAGVAGVLVLPLLSAGSTLLPIGQRSHHTCIDCGFYFQDRVLFGLSTPIGEHRPRTDWYDRQIGIAHLHRWANSSCTETLNLWQQSVGNFCGDQEPLVGSDSWLVPILLRLEPLGLDVQVHQELTHPRLDHRSAAAEACTAFDPAWKDDEVRRWWEKTSADLGTRKP